MFGNAPLHTLHRNLKDVIQLTPPSKRNCDISGEIFRLQDYSDIPYGVAGDMLRIRMENLPIKASLNGSVDDLDLEDDEGIGEESGFLYDSKLAVLAYQRNRSGVAANAFASYIERKTSIGDTVTLVPILTEDATTKFNKMSRKTHLTMKCAHADNPEFWAGDGTVAEGIRNLSSLNAPNLTITASVGHSDKTLDVRNVFDILRRFRRPTDSGIIKLEISGRSASDELLVVDLIRNRMVERAKVDVGNRRHAVYETRARLIENAYRTRHAELKRMFNVIDQGTN
jgi:hypothetical protein